MNYTDLDPEFANASINLEVKESDKTKKPTQVTSEITPSPVNKESASESSQGFFSRLLQSQKKDIAQNLISQAKEGSKSWYSKYLCNFSFLDEYFQVSQTEIAERLKNSLRPLSKYFIEVRPDFYGPFWIYTTLIFLIAACGSITDATQQKNNFAPFIQTAAYLIYFLGFGLPLILGFLMRAFGSEIKYSKLICTYGYSYSVFIPSVLICALGFFSLQLGVLTLAVAHSSSIILTTLWDELSSYPNKRKYLCLAIIFICQLTLLLMLKLYFISSFNYSVGAQDEVDHN